MLGWYPWHYRFDRSHDVHVSLLPFNIRGSIYEYILERFRHRQKIRIFTSKIYSNQCVHSRDIELKFESCFAEWT